MKLKLPGIFVLLALHTLSHSLSAQRSEPTRPNVVLILADDMGWGDVGMHDNPAGINTPNLEKIARQGARFDRFFVSPLCAPTRASILTGRYHLRTGVANVTGGLETMRTDEVTLAEVFKNAGYATGIFGKWHNGAHYPQDPNGQGFDEFFGFCGGHWTNYFDTRLQHNHDMVQSKGYITDVFTDAALAFIDKNRSQPFFCYIPYNAPHGPFQIEDKYFDKFKAKGINDKDAAIYGMVENVDENVGRVLQKLDALGITDNTIVIFMTDNGPNSARYNGNMKGHKAMVDEGGVRVPFFIRWPGKIRGGTLITTPGAHIDILPTLTELCKISAVRTKPLDGKSLAALLQGKTTDLPARNLYTHVVKDTDTGGDIKPFPGAIRTQQYRYIRGNDHDQLYDMVNDPGQQHDLASQQPEIVQTFRKQFDEWFADVTTTKIHPEITEVGYREAPSTELFAPDAKRKGALKYFATNGFAHDWFTGWMTTSDTATWIVQVVADGRYAVKLKYNCDQGFVGSTLRVEVDGQKTEKTVQAAFAGKVYPSPDRVTRIEAYEKEWGLLDLGELKLVKGVHKVKIYRTNGNPTAPFELKALVLKKL